VAEVQRTANLRGKPTIIVHGRDDTLVPPNFSSGPYVLRNAQVEGAASRVRYVEVTNAQHFDAFLPFPGYDTATCRCTCTSTAPWTRCGRT
jgi:hydroxybutyrate-dimer hydrolase